MKINNMKKIFKISHLSNEAVRMCGLHGIGKSQIVESFAAENDMHIETLFLSQQEVGDLIGIPDNKDGIMTWSKPCWLDNMEQASKAGKHCVLFLDELARAPLDVRQAALQLVLEGKIHQHCLPKKDGLKTFIVAADNPSDLYSTDDLDAALLDRFSTYDVEVSVSGFLSWARLNDVESVVTDYIAEYTEKLHFQNDVDKGSTPRAWSKLSDLLKNITPNDKEFILPIINSKVGETVGANFFHFYNNHHKIVKVEDILDTVSGIVEGGNFVLSDKKDQIKISKELSKLTKPIEAISATELAEKFRKRIENGEKELMDYLVVYLGSLNIEVMSSIQKSWKNSEDSTWFFTFGQATPGQWLTSKMLAVRDS